MPRRRSAILFNTGHPLCAGDVRALARRLDDLGWPDELPAGIETPLPPWDRRAVTVRVGAPTEGNTIA